jgi:cytochrome P450
MAAGDLIVVVVAAGAERFGGGRHACPGSLLACTPAAVAVACLAGPGRGLVEGATFNGYRPSVNVRQPMFAT